MERFEDECDNLPKDGKITPGSVAGCTIINQLGLGRAPVLGLGTISSRCFSNLHASLSRSQLTSNEQHKAMVYNDGPPENRALPVEWPSMEGRMAVCTSGVVPSVSGAETESADFCHSGTVNTLTDKEQAAVQKRRASVNTQRKKFSSSQSNTIDLEDYENFEGIFNPPDIVASTSTSGDIGHSIVSDPDVAQIPHAIERHVSFNTDSGVKSEKRHSQESSKRHSSAQDRRSDFKESGYGGSSGGLTSLETSQDFDNVFCQSDEESGSLEYSHTESSTNSFKSAGPVSREPDIDPKAHLVETQKEMPGTYYKVNPGDRSSDCCCRGIIPDWHGLGLSSLVSSSCRSCGHNMQTLKLVPNGGRDCGITESDVYIHQCPVSLTLSQLPSNCCENDCQGNKLDWKIEVAQSSTRSSTSSCPCNLASIQENDISYKSDSQIEALHKRYLLRLRDDVSKAMLIKGASPEEILAVTHPLWSESDGSGSPIDIISSDSTSIPLQTGLASGYSDLVSPSQPSRIVEKLRMSRCCSYPGCQDTNCIMGSVLQQIIEEYMNKGLMYIDHHGSVVLSAIAKHAEECDVELKCPVPWCSFFQCHDMPFSEQMIRLQQTYFSGLITLTLDVEPTDTYHQLDPKLANGCQEGVHWSAISRLGSFSNAVLAVSSNTEKPAYWVVKKVSYTHTREMHIEVLQQLTRQRHPRIARYLWLLEQEPFLYVASMFEGGSLGDRMNEKGVNSGLETNSVVSYMNQLTSAVEFLHKNQVAYLNWTVDNIIVTASDKFVKICNFSSAVIMDSDSLDEEYVEDLALLLPPRIIPPELYEGGPVVAECDIWGLGCLCYHMTTGHMIRPESRHLDPALVREQLSELTDEAPDISAIQTDRIKDIVSSCLQVKYRDRPSATDLRLNHLLVK